MLCRCSEPRREKRPPSLSASVRTLFKVGERKTPDVNLEYKFRSVMSVESKTKHVALLSQVQEVQWHRVNLSPQCYNTHPQWTHT